MSMQADVLCVPLASKPMATGEIIPDNVPVKSGTVNMTSSGVTTGQPSNGVSASESGTASEETRPDNVPVKSSAGEPAGLEDIA